MGPFMNAPSKECGEDGKHEKANCILDRYSLWRENQKSGNQFETITKMFVKSGSKPIQKGEFLEHKYDYEAGQGGFFKFT